MSNTIYAYIPLPEGGCADLGAIELKGYSLISNEDLKRSEKIKLQRDSLFLALTELVRSTSGMCLCGHSESCSRCDPLKDRTAENKAIQLLKTFEFTVENQL